MFGSRSFYPIGVNHACMITNAIVVCPVSFVRTWEGEAQLILKIIVEVQWQQRWWQWQQQQQNVKTLHNK
jgi:hypothetical protein